MNRKKFFLAALAALPLFRRKAEAQSVNIGQVPLYVPAFSDAERPAGSINGENAVFTLGNPPAPATSLILVRNGIVQAQGSDYTLAGNVVTFLGLAIPQPGDSVLAFYRFF